MHNFTETAVAATSRHGFSSSDEPAPGQSCHYGCSISVAMMPSLKLKGYLKTKNLILAIMLIAISAIFPINASAKIDPATLEKQRAENKARLEKNEELRTGKAKKRFFDKSEKAEAEAYKARTLKLDAIPSSPRRRAK